MTDFIATSRLPIRTDEPFRLFGNVELSLTNPGKLCKFIAEDAYVPDLGMRSLKNGMRIKVERIVGTKYREIKGDIKESDTLTKMVLRMAEGKIVADIV